LSPHLGPLFVCMLGERLQVCRTEPLPNVLTGECHKQVLSYSHFLTSGWRAEEKENLIFSLTRETVGEVLTVKRIPERGFLGISRPS